MTDQSFDLESLLRYSWDYFRVHADQRMSIFNFFVALAVFMTGVLVGTFHKNFGMPALGIVLGLGLGFVSFVFWKLDQRVKFLLKNVEASLAELEKHFPTAGSANEPHVTQLFSWESAVTRGLRSSRKRWSPAAQLSYAQSFNLLFLFFGLVGAVGFILSLSAWISMKPSGLG